MNAGRPFGNTFLRRSINAGARGNVVAIQRFPTET
jgi:hypothetical protein